MIAKFNELLENSLSFLNIYNLAPSLYYLFSNVKNSGNCFISNDEDIVVVNGYFVDRMKSHFNAMVYLFNGKNVGLNILKFQEIFIEK